MLNVLNFLCALHLPSNHVCFFKSYLWAGKLLTLEKGTSANRGYPSSSQRSTYVLNYLGKNPCLMVNSPYRNG
jgi:hypothetical protein